MVYIKSMVALLLILCAACEKLDERGSQEPSQELKKLVISALSEEARQKLGATEEDLVITLKQDGTTVLYKSEGKDFYYGDFPSDKYRLVTSFQLFQVKGSPTCYYYWDLRGNQRWYPRPDCPHN